MSISVSSMPAGLIGTQIPTQSLLKSMQSVLRAMFGLEALAYGRGDAWRKSTDKTEKLYKELVASGERLLAVLRFQLELMPSNIDTAGPSAVEQWRECRETTEALVEEYVDRIDRWRNSLLAEPRIH